MKTRYIVLGINSTPLPVLGYIHSVSKGTTYITLGKNPTAIPWNGADLIEVPTGATEEDIQTMRERYQK